MKRTALVIAFFMMCIAVASCSPAVVPQESNTAVPAPATSTPAAPSPTAPFAIALNKLPKEYASEAAAANGDYVNVHGQISNEDKLTAFLDAASAKKRAAVRMVQYTVEGDPIISDIIFDGGKFTVWYDTTRDAFGEQKITQSEYQNMLEYEADGTTYIFLTNEKEITKDLFENGFDGHLLMTK